MAENRPMREKMVIKLKIYVRHTFREHKCVFLVIQQETESFRGQAYHGSTIGCFVSESARQEAYCLFSAVGYTPERSPLAGTGHSTDLGRTAFTAVLEVISTCLEFAFKVSVLEFGLVPSEDSLY